jgi:hypothetical protein
MLVKSRRSDAGSYSCVAKNAAGESEAPFTITVLTAPHIDEPIDQTPRVVQGTTVTMSCPVLGNPQPEVEWRVDGRPLTKEHKRAGNDVIIESVHVSLRVCKAPCLLAGRRFVKQTAFLIETL